MERIYILPLAKDTENPLGPRSDEVGKKKKKDKTEDEKKSPGAGRGFESGAAARHRSPTDDADAATDP